MPRNSSTARQVLSLFANKRLLHITLPAIMLYLVAGTIAQKSIGLYDATHRYFMAPLCEVYGLPLPGMPVFVALLVVNLLAHLILTTEWSRARVGTIITHFGVVFLLAGALLTSLSAQEGYMDLSEGERSSYVSDYHQRVLVIRNEATKLAYTIPFDRLIKSHAAPQRIADTLTLRIQEICRNCELRRRTNVDEHTYGMARGMQLVAKPGAINNEENLAGLSFTVEGSAQDGLYTALENVAVIPKFAVNGETFSVAIEKQRRPLPFTVELLHTERTLYPGTEEAQSYRSRIRIEDANVAWEANVSMNQPARYKGFALFQSSYIEAKEGRRSVLAVVYNPIRTFPYLATAVIALGMIWHVLRRRGRATSLLLMCCAGVTMLAAEPGQAAGVDARYDVQSLSRLPVLSEGRIKPIDSVARERMKFISGTERNAIEAFSSALFWPERAEALPVIRVPEAATRSLLELPDAEGHRYTARMLRKAFAEHQQVVAAVLDKPEAEISEEQRGLRDAYERYKAYRDVSHGLDPYRALAFHRSDFPLFLRKTLEDETTVTFESTMPLHARIEEETATLVKRKGSNFRSYTPAEQSLSYFSFVLASLRSAAENAVPLNVIHNQDFSDFTSPWGIVLEGKGGPGYAHSVAQWKALLQQSASPADWNATVQSMRQSYRAGLGYRVEWWSNHVPLRTIALCGYAAAFFMLLCMHALGRYRLAWPACTLAAAALAHGLAVLVRIIILGRPPVGTLYESILFAGWVLAALCCWLYYRRRDGMWLWQGALGGLALVVLAIANDQPSGDNKTMLTAVLNTNFWLTTHVLTITAGYAFSLLTALLAHMLLLTGKEETLYPTLKRTALLALLFTATGTMLGGIWADQSWGRFWGWDPKENGALLIVLWLIWFIHGDVTRSMARPVVVAGLALVALVVALSWFGVNLLSIGLHSYGFTQGVQWGLLVFGVAEILLVAALLLRTRYRRGRS